MVLEHLALWDWQEYEREVCFWIKTILFSCVVYSFLFVHVRTHLPEASQLSEVMFCCQSLSVSAQEEDFPGVSRTAMGWLRCRWDEGILSIEREEGVCLWFTHTAWRSSIAAQTEWPGRWRYMRWIILGRMCSCERTAKATCKAVTLRWLWSARAVAGACLMEQRQDKAAEGETSLPATWRDLAGAHKDVWVLFHRQ